MAANYRYYITDQDNVTTEVFPLNKDALTFKFEKKIDSAIVIETVLETELVFDYISGAFNFKTQETNDRCSELEIEITRRCGAVYNTFYTGAFYMTDGKFDDDRCIFTVKPTDKYSMQYDLEVNILETPNPIPGGVDVPTASGTYNFPQARWFEDVLLYVAQKANPRITAVVSDIFQINQTGANYMLPYPEYPGLYDYYNMVVCNLSDVQIPVPSNVSTKGMITFKDLMDDLNVMFDVFWFVDSNNNLRVEHRTWFEDGVGIDLTQPQYSKWMVATDKYSYDNEENPIEEVWKIAGNEESARLVYGIYNNVGKKKSSKTYTTNKIYTDVMARFGAGADEGLFLMQTDGLAVTPSCDFSSGRPNRGMHPGALVINFHRFSRPRMEAIFEMLNSDPYYRKAGGLLLESTAPVIKQQEVKFPLCCDDTLDLKKQIQTALGVGYIDKGSFETKTSMVKVELKYKTTSCPGIVPTDLPNCDLWLRSDAGIVVSGGLVTQWSDYSGNNRHAVQANPANQPGYNATDQCVEFNNGQSLVTPAFQLFPLKRGTIIILFDTNNPQTGSMAVISTNTGGAGNFFDIYQNLNLSLLSMNEGFTYPANIDTSLPASGLFTVNRYHNTFLKTMQNSINSYNNPAVNSNTQPDSNPVIIGSNLNVIPVENSFYRIKEIIIYGRSLSDSEQSKIDFYLIQKGIYGIHPSGPFIS